MTSCKGVYDRQSGKSVVREFADEKAVHNVIKGLYKLTEHNGRGDFQQNFRYLFPSEIIVVQSGVVSHIFLITRSNVFFAYNIVNSKN